MKKKVVLFSMVVLVVFGALALSSWTSVSHNHSDEQSGWICDRCNGNGHDYNRPCYYCNKRGKIKVKETCQSYGCKNGYVIDQYGKRRPCLKCGGRGWYEIDADCPKCGGWGCLSCLKCGGSGEVNRN